MAGNKKLIQLFYTDKKKYLCSKCALKIFKRNKAIPRNIVSYTSKICVNCRDWIE